MSIIFARYETIGTPVEDPDYPSLDIGYDDIQTGYAVVPEEHIDIYADGDIRSFVVIAEQPTIGM